MASINANYFELQGSYLFSEIARRVAKYKDENPAADIIRMGIGDVTRPIAPAIIEAMHRAVDEMGAAASFRGYGPEQGYDFLLEAIRDNDYKARGVDIESNEIFVSDGAKCDVGNIQELFAPSAKVAVTDPVYPVYVDTNVMAGRAGKFDPAKNRYSNIVYLPCNAENGFVPELPEGSVDMIYLCFPNNPTGTTLTKDQLKPWVDYAKKSGAVILFDSAYEAYITQPGVPHSIYEIEGAKEVAIEMRSFSKTAGFTGLRCAYTVVPKALTTKFEGKAVSLNELWNRRHTTKFNGVSYVTQRAAEAVYSPEGKLQIRETIDYYMQNARLLTDGLQKLGYEVFGGVNAPYIWLKTPSGVGSWEFFDELLNTRQVVGTPGAGFGVSGEGYLRLTAFSTRENTQRALERLR